MVDKGITILASELPGAKEKLDEISQHLKQMKGRADDLPASCALIEKLINAKTTTLQQQLKAMDVGSLEKEHESLLDDISAEADFLQPLEKQKEKLEGRISQVINCTCGEKYMVALEHIYTETAVGSFEKE
ncbi:hypothetical protein MLD38_033633 [Melastoma candidum]|uniref:Uncharacterized protein n=1 Tax=Melastoma candidum TaxID=119954 RepID=A0ACB9M7D8_9MYRT|nr:hypothetical protein MLD38_033633 [Melastoma candidum]